MLSRPYFPRLVFSVFPLDNETMPLLKPFLFKPRGGLIIEVFYVHGILSKLYSYVSDTTRPWACAAIHYYTVFTYLPIIVQMYFSFTSHTTKLYCMYVQNITLEFCFNFCLVRRCNRRKMLTCNVVNLGVGEEFMQSKAYSCVARISCNNRCILY